MSRGDDLKKLIAEHYRHLHILKVQEAKYGSLNVPTYILTQIQDREAEIEKLQAELARVDETEKESTQPKLATSPAVAVPITSPFTADPQMVGRRAQLRIFLCHAAEDKPRVKKLYHDLEHAGYRPWLDKFDLLPGQKWRREIEKIIRDPYNLVLVCLSKNSITKQGVVQQEIQWALDILEQMPEETIYLIPVRLEACQAPDQLSDLHWVNLFEPEGFAYLTRALDYEIGKRHGVPDLEPVASAKIKGFHEPEPQPAPRKSLKIRSPQLPFEEPELILIPAGKFLMGSDPQIDRYAKDNEQPQHLLHVPAYSIAKTPVTNAQYAAFVQATRHRPPQHWAGTTKSPQSIENHPVVYVSWQDAAAYCRWLAHVTKKPYRLPTEAEWEKAARGTDGRIYPWGNERDATRCNAYESDKGATTPVGSYLSGASPYGVLDMAGNIWEWCATKQDKLYPYGVSEDEWTDNYLKENAVRVLRGGAFNFSGSYARCAFRARLDCDSSYDCIGFRVVVSAP
jgi:formylglycine-generating enzyme required for sulfatase activity